VTTEQPRLRAEHCLARQQRVREALHRLSADRAIFVSHENIEYLTGFRPHRLMQAAVCLETDGKCVLSAPNAAPEDATADVIVTFEAQWCATLRQEQAAVAMGALADSIKISSGDQTAVEFSVCGRHIDQLIGSDASKLIDIDAEMWKLRRYKYPDELAMISQAVRCTEAMYEHARQIIEPGLTELQLFGQLHAIAVETAGEQLTALGNDYQCNSPGGPPRDRAARDGELYILDLGPAYRGYYADNCRTIAVNRRPTDEQYRAWESVVAVLSMVEDRVRPGVSCRDLFQTAKSMLDEYRPDAFSHHLGHGFGLFPHEAPHLNPNWDDKFEAGDVFTAEPGLYTDQLAAGIRLEQNYRVTADGVELLTDFSLEL
jgi:Xaa-Pro dipeptidase